MIENDTCPYCGGEIIDVAVQFDRCSKARVRKIVDKKKKFLFFLRDGNLFWALQMHGKYCQKCHRLVFECDKYMTM